MCIFTAREFYPREWNIFCVRPDINIGIQDLGEKYTEVPMMGAAEVRRDPLEGETIGTGVFLTAWDPLEVPMTNGCGSR